jgi:hypothetical protein
MSVKGFETKYDKYSGEWIENQKNKYAQPGVKLNFGKRFCEACKSFKKKTSEPAIKGWKCTDCRNI